MEYRSHAGNNWIIVLRPTKKVLTSATFVYYWGSDNKLRAARICDQGISFHFSGYLLEQYFARFNKSAGALERFKEFAVENMDLGAESCDQLGELRCGIRHDYLTGRWVVKDEIVQLTTFGDFRFHSYGPYQGVLDALALLRPHLGEQVHAVLGNHDSIRMVPGMEARGFPVLMNEMVLVRRGDADLALAGIDDAHFFRTHNLHKALADVAPGACTVLLSHTPEPYRQAAHAGVSLMLSGHTHGGQVCLPGGVPILVDTATPRAYVRGAWRYRAMAGYTSVGCGASVVDVRLNCLPELTLHRLQRG